MILPAELRNRTQTVSSELQRITVLLEEQVLGSLLHLLQELSTLKARCADLVTGMHQNKNSFVQAHLMDVYDEGSRFTVGLVRAIRSTLDTIDAQLSTPSTPHELSVSVTYRGVVEQLRVLLGSAASAELIFGDFLVGLKAQCRQMLKSLGRARPLLLSKLSPLLSDLRASEVPMPGSPNRTIHRIEEELVVLATKTRPKKLVFVSADGIRTRMLLKGHEDLRLDQRIMQLLDVVNGLVTKFPLLQTRTYEVVPLARRSAILKWIDDAVSLFTVYRKRQLRDLERQSRADAGRRSSIVLPRPARDALHASGASFSSFGNEP